MVVTLYGFFRFLHVVSAIFAMGPHFVLSILLKHLEKEPESAPALHRVLDTVTKMPKHGAMLMLLTGVLMVATGSAGWAAFKEPWLAASLVLFFFTAIYGRVKGEPAGKKVTEMVKQGNIQPDHLRSLTRQMSSAISVMGICLVAIVVLMVVRPTF